VNDNFKRHPLQPILSACVPLAVLGASLFGPAAGPSPASARGVRSGGGGGASLGAAPGATITTPVTTGAPPLVRLVGGFLSVSGGGITLQAPQTGLLDGTVRFTGTVAQPGAGETVTIERQSAFPGYWLPATSAAVGPGGVFSARWRVSQSGSLSVRAVLGSPGASAASAGRIAGTPGTPALTLTVYRSAVATLFGPGLYGRRTACGERLTSTLIGVANRVLKCGSMVAIYYAGRELDVPVVDRGPYAKGVVWDLTMATAKAIGITTTATIGALWPPPAH